MDALPPSARLVGIGFYIALCIALGRPASAIGRAGRDQPRTRRRKEGVKARLIVIGAGGLAFLALLLYLSIFVFKAPKAIVDLKREKLVTIAEASNEARTGAITNSLFTAWVVMALLLLICFPAVRKRALLPSGLY